MYSRSYTCATTFRAHFFDIYFFLLLIIYKPEVVNSLDECLLVHKSTIEDKLFLESWSAAAAARGVLTTLNGSYAICSRSSEL